MNRKAFLSAKRVLRAASPKSVFLVTFFADAKKVTQPRQDKVVPYARLAFAKGEREVVAPPLGER